jgi:glutathione-specific gamma-glutamylcyclotransferase
MKPTLPFRPTHRTASQRHDNLKATLAAKPSGSAGVWFFVYGLLAKNPPFHYVAARPITLDGWQRRFHLADPFNRGNGFAPGLTLGLAPGGNCPGMAYLLTDAEAETGLEQAWAQEMLLPFYRPQWIEQDGRPLLVMTTDPASPAIWQPLPLPETAAIIAASHGTQGTNHAYLADVREAFRVNGIRDPYLEAVNDHLTGT